LYRINSYYYSDTGYRSVEYRSVEYRSVVQPLLEAMQSVASWENVNILTQEGDWLAKEWRLYTFWR